MSSFSMRAKWASASGVEGAMLRLLDMSVITLEDRRSRMVCSIVDVD